MEHQTNNLPTPENPSPVETIFNQCLARHDEFDRTVWERKDSFHNRNHVLADWTAAEKIIDAAEQRNDPLGIKQHIDKIWGEGKWSWEEFRTAAKVAIGCHDQGNIASLVREGDKAYIKFLSKYIGKGAEERSVEIALHEINNSKLNQAVKDKYGEMVAYLILQTKFLRSEDILSSYGIPLNTFMQAVDWVSTSLFDNNPRRSYGLARERFFEDPSSAFDTDYWRRSFNFAWIRMHELLPLPEHDKKRNALIAILGGQDKFCDQEKTHPLKFLYNVACGMLCVRGLKPQQ